MIKTRRDKYFAVQKVQILAEDAARFFFKNVRKYKSTGKPAVFDVRTLCPGKLDLEDAEQLADYFNAVSGKFSALEPAEIQVTHTPDIGTLAVLDISSTLRNQSQWLPGTSSQNS